ncbi:SNARE domain containing protein [Histomonas meleagridis]|uniref:SNARE domain containing protein n=1 Tax=Histomonas meleagridis TaxID=135588 RepID=UPI003559979B|nr:SNARE domain containing protein [Histomonas meleagridis]KAH0798404.1 SNARE domain containing protein [Histomonas meleagridis]
MNRTSEFFSYLKQIPPRNDVRSPPSSKPSKFSISARDIKSRLLYATDSIETLRSLMKNGNVLNQDETQIQELIFNLNEDIRTINQKIQELEQIKPQPQYAYNIAQSLRRVLATITEDFKAAIQERSEAIQKIKQRRQNFGVSTSPKSYSTTYSVDNDEVEIPMQSTMMEKQQRERYDMVRNVEQAINEISQMFVRLSEIIASQDYEVFRIDQNTEEALSNIREGQNQLVKYYEKIKGNKCLMLKIFAVLIVFSLVFILII